MSGTSVWTMALIIGLVAALVVAGLLIVLVRAVNDIRMSTGKLLGVAGAVAGQTAHIPKLDATAPVLGLIVDEAVIQDGYMNALTDGYGGAGTGADTAHATTAARADLPGVVGA